MLKFTIKFHDSCSLYVHNYAFPFERQMSWKVDKVVKWQLQNIFTFSHSPIVWSGQHIWTCFGCKPSRNELQLRVMTERKQWNEQENYGKWFVNRSNQTGPPCVGGLQFWWLSQNWLHQLPNVQMYITTKRHHYWHSHSSMLTFSFDDSSLFCSWHSIHFYFYI